ncbi:MAG: SAF domain-containing protein, partial [Bdellovibrionales bacterium]|nr:SAF domain-containing protein [Bdellovibrionales bacterium]
MHPSLLAPKVKRWQFPVAIGLVVTLLLVTAFRGSDNVIVQQDTRPKEELLTVVVTTKAVGAGDPFDQATLALEPRPINTLPNDVITSFELLDGKVAAGPIPAGYPLALALLAESVPLMAPTDIPSPIEADPFDILIKEIERETVAVPLQFMGNAPERGKRVALAISGRRGETVLVIDDAWVTESSGSMATLRVAPKRALFLQSVKNLGSLTFIE